MKFLSFDIESCDGRIDSGGMCSFGYCLSDENFNILDKKDILINPRPKKFEKKVAEKLRYSEETFRNAPKFPSVYKKIRNLLSQDVVILGYSVLNDVLYLDDACRSYKLPYIDYKFVDVQCIYDIYRNSANSIGLKKAANDCNINLLAHRSDEDAKATLFILKYVLDNTGKTFSEIMLDYEILPGKADKLQIKKCLTNRLTGEINYSSATIKKRIIKEFINLRKANEAADSFLSGKKIYLEEEILIADCDDTLRMLDKIYQMGGIKSEKYDSASVYVYPETQDKYLRQNLYFLEKKNKIKCYSFNEFKKMIGQFPELKVDKAKLLKLYKTRQNNQKSYAYRKRVPIKFYRNKNKKH